MKEYLVLVSETSKINPKEESDVYRFESIQEFLTFVKKVKFQEKINCNYYYVLSDGVGKDFSYNVIEKANHYKKFKKLIKKYLIGKR
ncbi:hypothetical protein Q4R90_17510 [Morganella morganii]